MTPKTHVIILAAGRGSRAGGGLPKQWRDLSGKPLICRTVAAFKGADITLIIHPEDEALARETLPHVRLIHGGATRAQSVRNALESLVDISPDRVFIHDGARPFVSESLIKRLSFALTSAQAAAPALVVTDALWRGDGGLVRGTQSREGLYRAQTPQVFHYQAILAAHRAHEGEAADDVEVARAAGLDVAIVDGEEDNMKVTWPEDFARAAEILKGRDMDIRMGNGFDVHAFTEGDHVWLCGVKVPHTQALLGHSDADVGMHALTDAIYGALGDGDIGRHFPDTDPQWKGAESHIFLRHAVELAAKHGYRIGNVDVTLMCERPKISPHAIAMQNALAEIMGCDPSRVSVKGTTTERLGFTGRGEGIASIATALLVKE